MIRNFIFFIGFLALSQKGCGQVNRALDCSRCTLKDSVVAKTLLSMNFGKYKSKEVSMFLADVNSPYADYVPITKKAGYIDRVMFGYSDSITVEFRVSDLNQTKPLNFGYTFDIEEFKKKKISMICFRYAGRCIKGCKDEFCSD